MVETVAWKPRVILKIFMYMTVVYNLGFMLPCDKIACCYPKDTLFA